MHMKPHQKSEQGRSRQVLEWNLSLLASAIYSFIDVIAQGTLVRRKPPKKKKNPGFSSHSSYSDIPLLGSMEPKTGCRSCSFHFSINILW